MLTKKNFVCKRCGECCKPVVLITKEEINLIKAAGFSDFLTLDPIHPENGYVAIKKNDDGYCIFFDKNNKKCIIYRVRPDVCRLYPFSQKDVLETNDCRPRLF